VASGHTTTGFSTIYSKAFVSQWGIVATLATTFAMAIGASACSTGGGIKGIRIGLVTKSFVRDVRRLIAPESAVIGERIHHIRSIRVDDTMLRSAMTITIAYVLTYVTVATVGALCGYDFVQALFEGVSAASNTGLSCGVTDPSMPWVMKAAYIVVMWLGRLEFMAVFALGGYALAAVRGR
jgi:trk system potassium uptake protein TrkH